MKSMWSQPPIPVSSLFFWQHNITFRIWLRNRNETQLRFAFMPSKRLIRFSKPILRKDFLVIQIPSDSKNPYNLPHLQGYIAHINRYYSHRLASLYSQPCGRPLAQFYKLFDAVVVWLYVKNLMPFGLIQTREGLNQDHILYCFRWHEIKCL